MKRIFLLAAAAALAVAPLRAQIVTKTTGTPTEDITPLGRDTDFDPTPSIPTAIAQTFRLPGTTNYLQMFKLFISGGFGTGGDALQLVASVYEFDEANGNLVIGSKQFSRGPFLGTADPAYHELDFGPALNLLLTPGTVYALVLSSVEDFGTQPPHATISVGASDGPYADGSLFVTNVTNESDLFTSGAFQPGAFSEAAFSAAFSPSPVPEPSSIALVATGLIGLGVGARRRRQRQRRNREPVV